MKVLSTQDHSFHTVRHCQQCKAELEIELSDIKHEIARINAQNWDDFYVDCPICFWRVYIDRMLENDIYGDVPVLTEYQRTLIKGLVKDNEP